MSKARAAIGIHHGKHRRRVIAIGEKIGLYEVWPMSKGCAIPYAPTAIDALAKRQG